MTFETMLGEKKLFFWFLYAGGAGCEGAFGESILFLSQSADSHLKHAIYHNKSVDHHRRLPASSTRPIFLMHLFIARSTIIASS